MAAILPQGKTQFCDANGSPLAGGSVTFYVRGTTTLKATFQDIGLTIPNTNPVILDASGSAEIWGAGAYTQIVADLNGNQIYEADTSDGTTGFTTLNTLANVAALQAVTAVFTTAVSVVLAGNVTPGDGLGGLYTFNPSSTAADNGGTVINQASNTGAGRWILNGSYGGLYNLPTTLPAASGQAWNNNGVFSIS